MTDLRDELDALKLEVRRLRDRQEILDCVNAYCRGLDRMDAELLRGTYHPGAIDRHGPFIGTREEFVPWAMQLVAPFPMCHHSLTTHTCSIEGDVAHAESYCVFFTVMEDGRRLGAGAARYIDQLARRDGIWAITARCEIMDCCFDLTRSDWLPAAWEEVKGKPDRSDLSYARPLTVPAPGAT